MRLAFIVFRMVGYAAVLTTVATIKHPPAVWLWIAASSVWSIYDHLKRPDDSASRLRIGAWLEAGLIVISTYWLHQPGYLFLLLSPVARTCVHLSLRDSLWMGVMSVGLVWIGCVTHQTYAWVPWVQSGAILAVGSYSVVMGLLIRQRDRLRKTLSISVFEQEQRARDEERLRIATQLHDVMGQYWTGVIRALDVASATDGAVQQTFLHKAREAAVDGLAEMRQSVQSWNQGRQSAEAWMTFLEQSVGRLRDLTGSSVTFVTDEIDWRALAKPELTAEAIARIVIESITNAIRHGHADRVECELKSGEQSITVRIVDNGRGLQSAGTLTRGTGLRSMEQLAASINGLLAMHGTNTETRVELRVPYGIDKQEDLGRVGEGR